MVDIETSFCLNSNFNNIYEQISQGDGGKGGEFFFFSKDRKLILKTLTEYEFKNFQNILQDYYNYLRKNENSLITKFYGVFEF